MPIIDENGAIQSMVSVENTPYLYTPCHGDKPKNWNDLRCQLELLCDKANEFISLEGDTLTLLDGNGDTSSTDLSKYLDDTNTTYGITFDVTSNEIVLIDSEGVEDRVVINFNFNLLTPQQCQDLISNCTTELQDFVKTNETNTSLTFDSVNNVITYTNEDGTNFTVDLTKYLDDVTVVSGVLDANTGVVTYTRDDSTTFTVDFSGLLDDTNDFVVSGVVTGTDLVLTRDSGTEVTIDLSGFVSVVTPVVTGGNVIATHVDTSGNSVDIEETITSAVLNGNGIDFTNEVGVTNTIDLSGFISTDDGDLSFDTTTNVLTHTNSDGTTQIVDLSILLDDTNEFVVSGVVTGTDLTLTLDSGSVVTTDLSGFVSVVTPVVTGGNVIATHIDTSGNSVDIEETITTLDVTDLNVNYNGEDGTSTNVDLTTQIVSAISDPSNPINDAIEALDQGDLTINSTTNELVHTTSNGTSQTPIDLSPYLDNTFVTFNEELDATTTFTSADGATSTCVLSCPPAGTPEDASPVVQADGTVVWETPVVYTLDSTALVGGQTEVTLTDSEGTVQTVTIPYGGDGVIATGVYLPDSSDVVAIPVTQLQPNGAVVNIGNVQIDLSGLVPTFGGGYYYDPTTNKYTHIDSNGITQTADITDVDTSVAGEVTFTDPNGDTVTIQTVDNGSFIYDIATNTYVHNSSTGVSSSVPVVETVVFPNGKTSIILPSGGASCVLSCPPTGTPDNAVPTTQSDGGVVWEAVIDSGDLSINANVLTHTNSDGTTQDIDLSLYLDDTNLARIVNGTLDAVTGIATFTRDDTTSFTLDLSSLLDVDTISTVTQTVTAGNEIALHDADGSTPVSILETVTTIGLTGSNLEYVDESGVTQTTDLSSILPIDSGGLSFDDTTNILTHTNSDGTTQNVGLSNLCLSQIKTQTASFDLVQGSDLVNTTFNSQFNQILDVYINDDVVPLTDGVSLAGRRTNGTNTTFGLVGRPDANYVNGLVIEYITKC